MGGNQDVAGCRFKEREALLKTLQQIRVRGEFEAGRRDRSQAVRKNHAQALTALA